MDVRRREWWGILVTVVEPERKRRHDSFRAAARRAGMSEATWRQLVAGRHPSPGTGHRWPTREQLLDMAEAVGVRPLVAHMIAASDGEVSRSRERLRGIPNDAENELMNLRHLTPEEKLRLIDALRDIRAGTNGDTPEGIAS